MRPLNRLQIKVYPTVILADGGVAGVGEGAGGAEAEPGYVVGVAAEGAFALDF